MAARTAPAATAATAASLTHTATTPGLRHSVWDVAGQPTEVLELPAASEKPDVHLLVVPGNPGESKEIANRCLPELQGPLLSQRAAEHRPLMRRFLPCKCPGVSFPLLMVRAGAAPYYEPFMLALHRQLGGRAAVSCPSNLGMDCQGLTLRGRVYSLEEQVAHKQVSFLITSTAAPRGARGQPMHWTWC